MLEVIACVARVRQKALTFLSYIMAVTVVPPIQTVLHSKV